ncbi:unnamed protein product [Didymodactylos carnosus]|uniref:Uncharacterized protein n=1 Tax=Didymodactylos carnosus TaxID=1234261 RepID=A0A814N0S1_9BILA|nr:unnamed protein product [Didymodactylos carnosus]CAF3852255.1 unnamed protein product [Didymodactylos carnosus]
MTTLTTNTVSKRKQRPYKRITEFENEIVPRLYNELRKPCLVVENTLSVGYGEMTTFYRSLPNKTSQARRINTTLQAAGKIRSPSPNNSTTVATTNQTNSSPSFPIDRKSKSFDDVIITDQNKDVTASQPLSSTEYHHNANEKLSELLEKLFSLHTATQGKILMLFFSVTNTLTSSKPLTNPPLVSLQKIIQKLLIRFSLKTCQKSATTTTLSASNQSTMVSKSSKDSRKLYGNTVTTILTTQQSQQRPLTMSDRKSEKNDNGLGRKFQIERLKPTEVVIQRLEHNCRSFRLTGSFNDSNGTKPLFRMSDRDGVRLKLIVGLTLRRGDIPVPL